MSNLDLITYATDSNGALIDPHPWQQVNEAATNLHHYSRNLTNWVIRGVATVTYNQIGLEGIASTASLCHVTQAVSIGDIYYPYNAVTPDALVIAKVYIKAVSTTGLLTIQNQQGSSFGRYIIDMSLVSTTDFEVITESHPAVTSFTRFTNSTAANGYHMFTDVGAIDFIIGNAEWYENITESETLATPPVYTTTAAASIVATNYTHNLANIDPADSTIEFQLNADGVDHDVLTISGNVLLKYGDVGDGTELVDVPTNLLNWNNVGTVTDKTETWILSNSDTGVVYPDKLVEGEIYVFTGTWIDTQGGFALRCRTPGSGAGVAVLSNGGSGRNVYTVVDGNREIYLRSPISPSEATDVELSVQKTAATKGLILQDASGNIITAPIADGDRKIKIVLNGTTGAMQLSVDDVAQPTAGYTPIAAGLVTVDADVYTMRRSPAEDII